jgi:hypothetical protein
VTDTLTELATRAYVYGFPLVFDVDQVRRFVSTGVGESPAATFNAFSHAPRLAGPEETFVSINNDTVYSIAQLDLSHGPLLLDVPDPDGRYLVLQFISAWTENFAYLGTRTAGSAPGRYLVVGPHHTAAAEDDARLIRCPTEIVTIAGRWAVDGEADLPAVAALQRGLSLRQVNPGEPTALPDVDTAGLGEELAFWERYRVYSQVFAPPRRDEPVQAGFAPLGLTGAVSVAALDEDRKTALVHGFRNGRALLEKILAQGTAETANGWGGTLHAFDYNIDHFEIGTVNESHWKIADPDQRLVVRAAAAMAGLWGCHGYEAAYYTVYEDADGAPLSGEHTYELTFDPPPPNDAFWSLTMYDTPHFYLVANPIDRYSIGDRTKGLEIGADGAVTITIGAAEPAEATRRANWLPAPHATFRPMLRVYLPGESVLDGSYSLPPIRRLR